MNSLKTNRPRMNVVSKGYRVKKTISHDVTSRNDDMERKLYIFRAQAKIREKANRKSTFSSSRSSPPSTSKDDESGRSLSDARVDSGFSPVASVHKTSEETEVETTGTDYFDRIRAALKSENQALEAAVSTKEQQDKSATEPMRDGRRNTSGDMKATLKREQEDELSNTKSPPREKKKPIKFKDSLGRRFTFPFETCATWRGMETLIRQAFLHVAVIEVHVAEGHYDLVGPNGDIILPQVWDSVIEPDWSITMHMWPIPELGEKSKPPQVENVKKPRKMKSKGLQYLSGSSLNQAAKEEAIDRLQSLLSEEQTRRGNDRE